MTSNPASRKPVNRLTFEDFRAFPIWEYTDDEEGVEGQDETWVRPVASQVVPERSYTHVAAVLSTSRGRELTGFVTVSTLEGPPVVSPKRSHSIPRRRRLRAPSDCSPQPVEARFELPGPVRLVHDNMKATCRCAWSPVLLLNQTPPDRCAKSFSG